MTADADSKPSAGVLLTLVPAAALLLLVASCYLIARSPSGITAPAPGMFLNEGDTLDITNEFGTFRVTATSEVKRRFEWNGNRWERAYERARRANWSLTGFNDEPGLQYRGAYTPSHISQNGCVVIAGEGDLIATDENAPEVLAFYEEIQFYQGWAWSEDGYFVRTASADPRLSINIHRLLINGQPPTNIPDCGNTCVTFTRSTSE